MGVASRPPNADNCATLFGPTAPSGSSGSSRGTVTRVGKRGDCRGKGLGAEAEPHHWAIINRSRCTARGGHGRNHEGNEEHEVDSGFARQVVASGFPPFHLGEGLHSGYNLAVESLPD